MQNTERKIVVLNVQMFDSAENNQATMTAKELKLE